MNNHGNVNVGGLSIVPLNSLDEAVNLIFQERQNPRGFAVALNAEKVIAAREDATIRECFMSASFCYADGISVVKTIKRKGYNNSRIPGCELWVELMKRVSTTGQSLYLIGASEETNKATANKLKKEFGVHNLTRRNGYFKDEQTIIDEVVSLRPDIVTVALGSPKQEFLIAKMRKVHPDAFYMGVGGSYDVFVGHTKRAPAWVQKAGLEWLYRLFLQPSRAIRQASLVRYLWLHFTNKL